MVDLNPLHYINKFNHMFGDSVASGLEFLGISDPAVDPDGVREIAKKWRHLATGLEDASTAADQALSGVEWEGKAAKAFHKRSKAARKQAGEMTHSLREGAKALDGFADKAHELLSEIGVILAEIAEYEIAGLALSVLTGGASEVASTLMAGERAMKVVALVGRIEKEGTTLGSVVRRVMEVIRGVERALKALKEIRAVAEVGKLAGEGAKFSAFETLLKDPGAFKDPEKLAGILTEGALMGVGFGVLGKALGKGLKALKPSELSKLSKALGIGGSDLSKLKLRPDLLDSLKAGIPKSEAECRLDPIDVATGDVLLPQVDVELAASLPLLLERTHTSSYRWGGWFGPSWASTLDQRLQADDERITFAAPDGSRLIYPHPDPDSAESVLPETGPRLPLTWDTEVDGALRVTNPATGLGYVFHSPQPAGDAEAVDLPLQFIVSRHGQRITVHYDERNVPVAVTHSAGYRIELDHHNTLPRITGLRLIDPEQPNGRGTVLISYGYDEFGHLSEVRNSAGAPMHFTYDADGRITSWTDRNASTYAYTYDDQGRVIGTDGTGGYLSGNLSYDDAPGVTTVTNALGHTTTFEHNEAYRLVRETDALGRIRHQEWDTQGRLVATTDTLGNTTRVHYDLNGLVTSVVRPDGAESTRSYDDAGLPVEITGPDGGTWRQEYDEHGNRVSVTDPAGQTIRYTYDASGQLKSITDALGHVTRIRFNKAGLPIEITDPLGATTWSEYDAMGRQSVVTDQAGNVARFEWTLEGKPARRTYPDGTSESWVYDNEGNCTAHMDPLGRVTHFEYGAFDLLTARVAPDGSRYAFTHDAELRLTQVTNPQGLTWSYSYDPVGNLTAEADFDSRTLTYAYDAAGNLSSRTDAIGQVISYEYDTLGQMVRKNVGGQVTVFTYDLFGNLTRAMGANATLSLERDHSGRILAESVNGRMLSCSYDGAGRRITRTTPSGATTIWTYDEAGQVAQLNASGRAIDFRRDISGREVARKFSDSISVTQTYDVMDRLTRQAVVGPSGHSVQQRAYSYRADGNLIGIDDQLSGSRRFSLDAAARVTAVNARDWSEAYAYDSIGNQTQADWPHAHPGQEATGSRAYDGTRITRAGRVRYEYDGLGRIIMRQEVRISRKPDTWRYEWDAEDRLVAVATPDGTRWRYAYDPLGRRTAKLRLAPDGETVLERVDFTWDGTSLCEQTATSATSPHPVTLTWDYQGLAPIAQTERISAADASQAEIDSRFFAIVTDLVGTPTELIDEAGDIAWRSRSTLWGKTTWPTSSTAYIPLRFPGQYHDPETGLHYNYFRHYDPETARYLTLDPLGLEPAPNPVAYVPNPLIESDPEGLAPCRQDVADSFNVRRRAVINPKRVFRGDLRHPDWVFENGFTPKGTNEDIGKYALHDTPSNWVGTSKSASQAGNFPQSARGRGTWVYEIRGNGYGVDVNRSLGGAVRSFIRGTGFPSEREVIYRSIDPSNIVRAERWRYGMRTGEIIENPGFSGG
ncbi:DUF6531 domain-containing protein [Streptomyces yokosukanensis]|uniref:DUF6531 domain-containing protein n=1 Tax=Streptomyces yokosukanensis TaxID=67386 RepID=UPI003441A6D8